MDKEYLILRYSLVEEIQNVIESEPIPKIKGEAILPSIKSDREFQSNGVLFSILGFHLLEPAFGYDFPTRRFYIGKIAKRKKQQIGEKVPGDIVEFEHDNWIPISIIIDVETQHIFARKDWRFGNPEHIAKTLQVALTEPVLSTYNHRIFVEGRSNPDTFWKIIGTKNKIYRLELRLISPNILDTNQKARDALEALQDVFGQEELDITLKNEAGELKVPENPVSNYLEYIAEGEGSWTIMTEGDRGGKKTHSSKENIDTVNLPEIENETVDVSQMELDQEPNSEKNENYEEANLGAEIYATIKDTEQD